MDTILDEEYSGQSIEDIAEDIIEVEHKEAKAKGGDALVWENLLLSCKYCNTCKGTSVIIKKISNGT